MLPHPMQIFQWENYKRRVTGIKGDTWCGRDRAGRAGDRRPGCRVSRPRDSWVPTSPSAQPWILRPFAHNLQS